MQKLLESIDRIFYFIKWPYFIVYTLIYNYGFDQYLILDIFWFFCGILIAKDLYTKYKAEQANQEDSKE